MKKRGELHVAPQREPRELTRSEPHRDVPAKSADFVAALVGRGEADRRRLEAAISAVEGFGTVLPLDAATVRAAYGAENLRTLSAQDATVYASVRRHLGDAGGSPKCFLNRNSRDFALPEIVDELAHDECRVFSSFVAGLGHVRRALRGEAAS